MEENKSAVTKKIYDSTAIESGTGKIKNHDILGEFPDFMREADIIFSRPPCDLAKTNRQYMYTYKEHKIKIYDTYIDKFFEYIDKINPRFAYIVAFPSNREKLIAECRKNFKFVDIDEAHYYHNIRNRCWVIRCGRDEDAPGPDIDTEQGDVSYLRWVCKNVEFECIGDICIGQGLVAYYANKTNKKFCVLGLNKKSVLRLQQEIDGQVKHIGRWNL